MEVVTDIVHKDNILMAKRAAEIFDIDIAGIDFITSDISKSFMDSGGKICEINVTPGFIFNEVGIVFDDLFPGFANGRVPVVVFLNIGENSSFNCYVSELVNTLRYLGFCLVSDYGVFLNADTICDSSLPMNSRIQVALSEFGVDVAVICVDDHDVVEQGVSLEYIDFLFVIGSESYSDPGGLNETLLAASVLSKLSESANQFSSGQLLSAPSLKEREFQPFDAVVDSANN